jgi:xylulokinase
VVTILVLSSKNPFVTNVSLINFFFIILSVSFTPTMYLLGFDIGSSSIKASLIEAGSGNLMASAQYPKKEMEINSPQTGWAEQHPEIWWENLVLATKEVFSKTSVDKKNIQAIGISYQMHGLVIVDKNLKVLRPSIIWCDSRAVSIGEKAFNEIGPNVCLSKCLNSPANFTASKLKWVKDNEPEIYSKIYKAMLPGDYIALKLTGNISTTSTGLSEGILWDYKEEKPADIILSNYGISKDLLPEIVPVFSDQGNLTRQAANELGLGENIIVSYRAGDQPNNAFSLNVLHPGEIAATAGTSGVVYGVSDRAEYDEQSRVNTFLHVNHTKANPRLGILLCINGTGILNSWLKNTLFAGNGFSYEKMNELAAQVPCGAEGLSFFPYGNGAERTLKNKDMGASIHGLEFNRHKAPHILRAAQEGIVFSFHYGLEVMKSMGMKIKTIKAGESNMFLSPVFREALSTITGAEIQLYNTDGAQGAARGAGIGAGIYKNTDEAFGSLKVINTISPSKKLEEQYKDTYNNWFEILNKFI